MDVPPIADVTPEPPVAASAQASPPAPPSPASSAPLERRLAHLEGGLAEMNARLDALAVSLEASLREAVSQEVQSVSGELRRTVAELGRLLVRDLGKLSKLLSEHRDSIVAELRGTPPARVPAAGVASPAPPPPPAGDGDDAPEAESATALLDDEAVPEPSEAVVDGAGDGAEASERQRRSLLRRRHG